VLGDGAVVHWGRAARIRIRTPDGHWSGFVHTDLSRIKDLVRDRDGMLVWGVHSRQNGDGEDDEIVLLMTSQGRVVDRWDPGRRFLSSIFSEGGQRWATFYEPEKRQQHQDKFGRDPWPGLPSDPLTELLRGGELAERQTVEPLLKLRSFHGGADGTRLVGCVPSDETKLHHHPAYCLAAEPGGWREIGRWTSLPVVCGSYLVETFEGSADRSSEKPGITVRRLASGDKVGERTTAPGQAVACGADDELLVGKTEVQGLSLPDLRPLWRLPSPGGRVVALARDGDRVLASTPAGTVDSLSPPPRPAAPPRAPNR